MFYSVFFFQNFNFMFNQITQTPDVFKIYRKQFLMTFDKNETSVWLLHTQKCRFNKKTTILLVEL